MAENWQRQLDEWLEPFLERLGHVGRRHWAPLYLRGLLAEMPRKSVEPLAERVAPGEVQQMHHFLCASPWPIEPLREVLVAKAQEMLGGKSATLVVDDTPLIKQGKHSVGVARQWCGQLGKQANCQSLVTATLARAQVPLVVGVRLFLPRAWAENPERRREALVPENLRWSTKWQIALEEIDSLSAMGLEFGSVVADSDYGRCGAFRRGLSERGKRWAVGVARDMLVYKSDVQVIERGAKGRVGHPPARGVPSKPPIQAQSLIESLGEKAFRRCTWREGSKGPLHERFARVRVRVGEGPYVWPGQWRLPSGEALWLLCEERAGGERRYYLSNLPERVPMRSLVRLLKRHWLCEQAHEQMKQELGLSHFEGRSWGGLHHHALLVMMAFAFLQELRLAGKKTSRAGRGGAHAPTKPVATGAIHQRRAASRSAALPGVWDNAGS